MKVVIGRVAVLGAGVMGSGIAAHLANAGIPCYLLDVVPAPAPAGVDPSSRAFRDSLAAAGVAKLMRSKPAALASARAARLITIGNLEDDLALLGRCDWVIEAVKEDVAIKQALFARIEPHLQAHAIVSSNTSGLSIEAMLAGRSPSFRQRFLVTHFFNPVRYMKLLELVCGADTLPEVAASIHHFGESRLGKGIVYGKDTTNFIANRIGVYGMMKILAEMPAAGLTVEEIDKIFGPAMGRPKSAVFRTADLVGLDTLVHVAVNCHSTLVHDEEREVFALPEGIQKMVEAGMLGEKTKRGFYQKKTDASGKEILSLDLATMTYVPQKKVRFESLGAARKIESPGERIATIMRGKDKAAVFAEKCTLAMLAYAARRIPEIADDLVNVDRAMRWGFGWDLGPFEIWDAYGVQAGVARMQALDIAVAPWVEAMLASGRSSFYHRDESGEATCWHPQLAAAQPVVQNVRVRSVAALRREQAPVATNPSASLWDMGDGALLLEFHSKMNAIDEDTGKMMMQAIEIAERDFRGLVIGNDATNFSVGANIMGLLWFANIGHWEKIREMVTGFQMANQRMRYSRVPTVAAIGGMVLGGGCEVSMGCNAVQAALETYIGLVEVGVGLIPGGGGNVAFLRNVYGAFAEDPDFDPFPFIRKAFMTIGMGKVATSAEEAKEVGYLNASDGISMNRDFLLSDAKARVLGMADAFVPPRETRFLLPGRGGYATIDVVLYDMALNGQISAHDRLIGQKLAHVLTGGECSPREHVSESTLLELETEAFLSLCGEAKSKERIEYMLKNGKPLRN